MSPDLILPIPARLAIVLGDNEKAFAEPEKSFNPQASAKLQYPNVKSPVNIVEPKARTCLATRLAYSDFEALILNFP
jgi:hypothetical protein